MSCGFFQSWSLSHPHPFLHYDLFIFLPFLLSFFFLFSSSLSFLLLFSFLFMTPCVTNRCIYPFHPDWGNSGIPTLLTIQKRRSRFPLFFPFCSMHISFACISLYPVFICVWLRFFSSLFLFLITFLVSYLDPQLSWTGLVGLFSLMLGDYDD